MPNPTKNRVSLYLGDFKRISGHLHFTPKLPQPLFTDMSEHRHKNNNNKKKNQNKKFRNPNQERGYEKSLAVARLPIGGR